jgi:cysteine-rich repeat protein
MSQIASLLLPLTLLLGACPAETKPPPGPCGDGIVNAGEECDNGVLNSDVAPNACRSSCRLAYCGDGIIDMGELCDGDNLLSESCLDYGFDGGQLICDIDECTIITRHCTQCGDGLAEGGEACDSADLAGITCVDLGFESGTLQCLPQCAFDLTVCVGGCGNGLREDGEDCDGEDLGETTCEDLGFASGTLGCAACGFDRSGCVGGCGNGVVEPGEACDDGNDVAGDGCTDCRAGDGTFTAAPPLPTASHPTDLRVADLNGDGILDLVVGYAGEAPGWGGIAVHRGLGGGAFAPPVQTGLSVRTSALAVARFDADPHPDVALAFLGEPDDGEDCDVRQRRRDLRRDHAVHPRHPTHRLGGGPAQRRRRTGSGGAQRGLGQRDGVHQ